MKQNNKSMTYLSAEVLIYLETKQKLTTAIVKKNKNKKQNLTHRQNSFKIQMEISRNGGIIVSPNTYIYIYVWSFLNWYRHFNKKKSGGV
jgi:hypothetical protein